MPQKIIDFWFADETRKLWFNSTPEFDRMLCERFEDTLKQAGRASSITGWKMRLAAWHWLSFWTSSR